VTDVSALWMMLQPPQAYSQLLLCRVKKPTMIALSQSRDLQSWLHRRYNQVLEAVRCEVADLVVPEVALVKALPPRGSNAGRPGRFQRVQLV